MQGISRSYEDQKIIYFLAASIKSSLMKKIVLVLVSLFTSQVIVCAQTTTSGKKDIGSIEQMVGYRYPKGFKDFLWNTVKHKKTIQFHLLNEYFQLIDPQDYSLLEAKNQKVALAEGIGYAVSELQSYFGRNTRPKILPFATSLNHISDDKIDFLGILKSSLPQLNNKIVYINAADLTIPPVIMANGLHNLFGDYKKLNKAIQQAKDNILQVSLAQQADQYLHNYRIPRAVFSFTPLQYKKQTLKASYPQIVSSSLRLSVYQQKRKVQVTFKVPYKKGYYQQDFFFLDSNRLIKDEYSFGHRFSWGDYSRLYSFYIKSLFNFRTSLNKQGQGVVISNILKKTHIDDLLKNALWKYFQKEASPKNTQNITKQQYPAALIKYLQFPLDSQVLLEVNKHKFKLAEWEDGYEIEDVSQDLELYEVIHNLSQKKYNGLSDAIQALPFAMADLGDGKVKYLSVIRSKTAQYKQLDGKILLSNYLSYLWNPNTINSQVIYNSVEELFQKHPPKYQVKYQFKELNKGQKLLQSRLILSKKVRSFRPVYIHTTIRKTGKILQLFCEAQYHTTYFEMAFRINTGKKTPGTSQLGDFIKQGINVFVQQHPKLIKIAAGLNRQMLINYTLDDYIRNNK
ncbi:hypothetical protein BKI52_18375 [marine bacterium AO1-C]|nr:hypothetical protein BKI52_18375 [marine bacterium AO1-C]